MRGKYLLSGLAFCLCLAFVAAMVFLKRGQSAAGRTQLTAPVEGGVESISTNVSVFKDQVAASGLERAKAMGVPRSMIQDWLTPLNFYGLVVDQYDKPIGGAVASFSWNDLSPEGSTQAKVTSQPDGVFSLTGKHGKALTVRVAKEGFYTSRSNLVGFHYAGEWTNFVGDPKNPVLFHLFRKGTAEPVLATLHPMGDEGVGKSYKSNRDGSPVEIDLRNGNVAQPGQGHLKVEAWSDDKAKKPGEEFDWKCRISAVKGTIVESTKEFDFIAPLDGYQPEAIIDMPASLGSDWRRDAERKYFLKFNDGTFARIKFVMIPRGDFFFQLEAFLNPSGSRNLEYDPEKVIKQ